MPDKPRQPLKSALQKQQRTLSEASYPGDLANDILHDGRRSSVSRRLFAPALATAIIGIGVAIGAVMLQQDEPYETANPIARVSPEPVEPGKQTVTPIEDKGQVPPAAMTAKTAYPEIDRGLLPLKRSNSSVWLASARPHQAQLERQTRLAENPDPDSRLRVSLSLPTRRTIERALTRPLDLRPTPKPERTS